MKGLDMFDKKLHPVKDYHIWPDLINEEKGRSIRKKVDSSYEEELNPKGKKLRIPGIESAKLWGTRVR